VRALRRIAAAPLEPETWRDTGYLLLGVPLSAVAFGLMIGVTVSVATILILLSVPVLLLLLAGVRGVAQVERQRAAFVLGEPIPAAYALPASGGWFARVRRALTDPQMLKDLAWMAILALLGFAAGIAAASLWASALAWITFPAWSWSLSDDAGVFWGTSMPLLILYPPAGILLAIASAWVVRGLAYVEAHAANALLAPTEKQLLRAGGPQQADGTAGRPAADPRAALFVLTAIFVLAGAVVVVIWGVTGAGRFWPAWVLLGLALAPALIASVVYAPPTSTAPGRRLMVQASVSAVLWVFLVLVWALAGGGTFWPVWPLLGLALALAVHAVLALLWGRLFPQARERELEERVDVLTRTRRGALDVQADELRRIERDLHDGAQARLVSLSMRLGRAEEGLADQPEAADLVRQARQEASAAIAELRDLARGIAPPVLADRGLAAAVEGLGQRAAIPVTVEAEMGARPPRVIETAAYFVVAEALTNAAKHAPDSEALVMLKLEGADELRSGQEQLLTVEVADNGPGGADPEGGGLSGLRHRVEALDGTLRVISPPGEGTTIYAELPCES
jgi:signal transduction histidine kinase